MSTLVAGLRVDGIVAPLMIDHPMNGITFRAYVEQHLAPTLSPGDIVVCDNLQCHKSPAVRAAEPLDVDTLWSTIGQCLARFSEQECANHLANSGYLRMM
jgi:hypothetical protein